MGQTASTTVRERPLYADVVSSGESDYDRLRRLARAEAEARNQAFAESKAAYSSGNGRRAKELSNKGKEHARLMEHYDSKAAEVIFHEKNSHRPVTELDLHGLYVKEAVVHVEQRIRECQSRFDVNHLVIIVGRGKHSLDGIPKLKPKVAELIHKYRLRCTPNRPNVGCLYVEFVRDDDEFLATNDFGWLEVLFGSRDGGCVIL